MLYSQPAAERDSWTSTITAPSGAAFRSSRCDVFEHAYYHKDGPKRAAYIDNFIANLHWGRINARYKKYAK